MIRTPSAPPAVVRRLVAAATAATAAVLLALPGAASATDLHGITLRVGGQTDGLKALLTTSGALKGKQYAIKWATFTSGPPIMEALQSESIDLGGVGNTPPIFAAANRANFRIVAGIQNRDRTGAQLLARDGSGIASVRGLKGKRVAYTRGSISHSFLVEALARVGLKLGDVKLVDLQPADALAAFRSGGVDAWSVFEPFLTIAGSGGTLIPVGTGYAAAGLNVIAASNRVLGDVRKRTAIRDYLVRLQRALAWGDAHQPQWAKAFSSESGLPYDLALKASQKVDLIPARGAVVSSLQKLANVLTAAKVVKHIDVQAITSNQIAK